MAKKTLDIFVIILFSVPIIILFLILFILICIRFGSPVLFRQKRIGKGSRKFILYKFRSMNYGKDENGNLLPDDRRLDEFGRFLRKTSLDEIPGLFNILIGDMSLVGPRPLLPQYLSRYSPEQNRRHEVLPGITGWAQINGRNAISWEEKFKLDVWYVDHHSFLLDVKILFLTAWKTIRREGINQPGQATAEEFKGTI